jgi:hypothetical protein
LTRDLLSLYPPVSLPAQPPEPESRPFYQNLSDKTRQASLLLTLTLTIGTSLNTKSIEDPIASSRTPCESLISDLSLYLTCLSLSLSADSAQHVTLTSCNLTSLDLDLPVVA